MRSSVSLLTSTLSRREREAAGRPPSAMARQCTHIVEPAGTSRSRFDRLEPFGKDPPRASLSIAEEAAGLAKSGLSGRPRPARSRQSSLILAVHAAANASAHRAAANHCYASYRDHQAIVVFYRALNDKSARNKLLNLKPLHSSDPQPESKSNWRLDFIKYQSEYPNSGRRSPASWSGPLGADRDQAADLTACRVW